MKTMSAVLYSILILIIIGCNSQTPTSIGYSKNIVQNNTSTPSPALLPTESPTTPEVLPSPTFVEEPRPTLPDSNVPLSNETRSLIALRAATLAVESMPGPYSWEEFRSCSTFASAYLRELSFPVGNLQGKYADFKDPFPFSGVMYQLDWFNRNYPQYVKSAPLNDFLEGRLWGSINPGDLLYFQTAIGHNGYNTYYHVVVFMGMKKDDTPQFAEIAAGMKNASVNRTFQQMTAFYKQNADGSWNTKGYDTGTGIIPTLQVTIVDPLAILNQGKLWRKDGVVTPNASFLSSYNLVVTINIENGTLAFFGNNNGYWAPININGRTEFYSVVGRRLPANNTITQTFFDNMKDVYDGDYGVLVKNQVYQDTWTPPFISKLTGFERLGNFGGIGGSTDTSLLVPQILKGGKIVDDVDYSPFTFHLIPNVNNQDMLLREDLLTAANSTTFGPVQKPIVYLSSGCVNFDITTWKAIKGYLQGELDKGQKIAVVFSYPNFDQNLLLSNSVFKSPFANSIFKKWCDNTKKRNPCDDLDRRTYRNTYLGETRQ